MTSMLRPLLAVTLAGVAAPALAANSAPQPAPFVDTIPAARDVPYRGTLRIDVDATDNVRGLFKVRETVPVTGAGPMTLLYPKWLPGTHAPEGAIQHLSGLVIQANGRTLAWTRDPVDVFAFHVDVPAGVSQLDLQYIFLGATAEGQGPILTTPVMADLEWANVALYPAGYFVRQIPVVASLRMPAGWHDATALRPASRSGATVTYQPVQFDTLIDSPVYMGLNYRREPLSDKVTLNIFADRPDQLAMTPEQVQLHRNLVTQAVRLFGAQHYDHYDFLFSLSDRLTGQGLEHHRSSEDGSAGDYLTKWDDSVAERDLLPHEFTHSWDGKFRRPFDLWTPDYRTPMRDSLLWVYEGQTEFWGNILAARAGLFTHDQALDALAFYAANQAASAGREWRSVEDTTNDEIIGGRGPMPWRSWQRFEDYYVEGMLTWLDADAIIRERTHGTKSLDDFARAFFGVNDGDWGELTYTFDDVVRTLNGITPYDWAGFLNAHIYAVQPKPPVDWVAKGGYRLAFTDKPGPYWKSRETTRKLLDLTYSGGLVIGKEGVISSVMWDSPAFEAGLTSGTKIVAIDDAAYDDELMKTAITQAKGGRAPIRLLVNSGGTFRTVELRWTGGLRYPTLQRAGRGPASLDTLLAPR